jgi:Transcriptional regulator SbtR-like, C-terminal domain
LPAELASTGPGQVARSRTGDTLGSPVRLWASRGRRDAHADPAGACPSSSAAANDAGGAANTIGGTPGVAFTAWLRQFFEFASGKRHIASELLEHTNRSDRLFETSRARVIPAGRPLLAAAQAAHEVRDDLSLEQVLDMVIAIATIQGEPRYVESILQTAVDGLRASIREVVS